METTNRGHPTWKCSQPNFVHSPHIYFNKKIPDHVTFQKFSFMDDLQISYRSPDMSNVVQNFQICIDNLVKQADENGFKFSAEKRLC